MRLKITRYLLIPLALMFSVGLCGCSHAPADPGTDHPGGVGLFNGFLSIYEGPLNHLTAVRRGSCPMYPSCSQYSRQAMASHGAVIGWAMAMDRLLRCGRSETQLASKIFIDGQWKVYDPLEANDHWWHATNENLSYLPDQPNLSKNDLIHQSISSP